MHRVFIASLAAAVGLGGCEDAVAPASAPPAAGGKADGAAAEDEPTDPFEVALLDVDLFFRGKGIHTYPDYLWLLKVGSSIQPWNVEAEEEGGLLPSSTVEHLLRKTGFIVHEDRLVGVFEHQFDDHGFVVFGCAACHTGKAAGVLVPGLGNKRINLHGIGQAGLINPHPFSLRKNPQVRNANRMKAVLDDPAFYSPTFGLVENNVLMETFYQAFGLDYEDRGMSFVNKVPHLWRLADKERLGLFWDGCGDPEADGWLVGPEIMNGQTAQNIESAEYQAMLDDLELAVAELSPPPYPFAVDAAAAERGREVFERGCAGCHGDYGPDVDADERVPVLVAQDVVGTDPNRAAFFAFRPFWADVADSEYSELLRPSDVCQFDAPHYVAPRLDGIWARFPYLHNGSVPNLAALLTDPAARPRAFSLRDAGERRAFDEDAVGLRVDATAAGQRDLLDRADAERVDVSEIYDTRRPGHGNHGHAYGTTLSSADKADLLAYLETL